MLRLTTQVRTCNFTMEADWTWGFQMGLDKASLTWGRPERVSGIGDLLGIYFDDQNSHFLLHSTEQSQDNKL